MATESLEEEQSRNEQWLGGNVFQLKNIAIVFQPKQLIIILQSELSIYQLIYKLYLALFPTQKVVLVASGLETKDFHFLNAVLFLNLLSH